MLKELLHFLGFEEKEARWKTMPVGLTPEAVIFVAGKIKEEGNPASFGGAVTALRLIEEAARDEFGPILENPRINPLPTLALRYLMEIGALDLSASNIKKAYEENRKS